MSDTSLRTSILSEISTDDRIPEADFEYFEHRLLGQFYDLVATEFIRLNNAGVLTKAKLARRIGRSPAQVTRWLSSPRNWETKTLSRLMLGMGAEPESFGVAHLKDQNEHNYDGPDWIYRRPAIAEAVNEMQRRMQQPTLPQDDLQVTAAGLRTKERRDNETERDNREPGYPNLPRFGTAPAAG